jgi:sulfur relay (sulfurtransferase) DsrF/TusC family protein
VTNYLFIESRDPFDSRDTRFVEETAVALKKAGHEVTVFLVQNGVLATRSNAQNSYLSCLTRAGVNVLVDDFSLTERGIQSADLLAGIQPAKIESLVDALVQANTKAIWH